MIKIQNLTKEYSGGKTALKDISLSILPGVHGLLGPNGAGKTTLMRIVSTLLAPTKGTVRVFGHDPVQEPDAVRSLIGYLPQDFGLYPELTAGEFLDYMALLAGISSAATRKVRIEELLKAVNLWDVRSRKIGHFSGGMKQRLGIAQTLLNNPRLIIVDEPTAGLDPEERLDFRNLLAGLLTGTSDRVVIISTHIVEDLTHMAQQVSVLLQGELLFNGEISLLAAQADDKVFETEVEASQVEQIKGTHLITSYLVPNDPKKVRLRIIRGPGELPEGARPLTPTLEDGYLSLVRRGNHVQAHRG